MAMNGLPEIDRRALLRTAILLVGGSMAGIPAGAFAQDAAAATKRFFTLAQFAVLDEVAAIIIPKTDTPGAREAGVPANVDMLMSKWASEERQEQFRAMLDSIGGAGLMRMKPAERLDYVRKYDAEHLHGEGAYGRFKELVLTLYYLSEPGATQELRYELSPGKWDGWTEMTPDTRAWAV
jgi:hypothetical protein